MLAMTTSSKYFSQQNILGLELLFYLYRNANLLFN